MNTTRSNPEIVRRRVDFDFDEATVPRAWMNDDLHVTTFMSALSLLFPEGERFFVESVRDVQSRVTDPALRAQIAGFIGQEAMHAKAHRSLNALARARAGDVVDRLEDGLRVILKSVRKGLRPEGRLAATCALEHFTAMMAERLLNDGEEQRVLHESVRGLWLWHALEESEHKAVAFDVYESIGGGYPRRALIMLGATIIFYAELFHVHSRMLAAQGELWNVRGWLRATHFLWVKPGMFRKLAPVWLDYFRPGFHPNDRDTNALLARWRDRLFGARGVLTARFQAN
jgi:predicted metal-dependent hydrolase